MFTRKNKKLFAYICFIVCLLFVPCLALAQQIFEVIGSDGSTTYTTIRPKKDKYKVIQTTSYSRMRSKDESTNTANWVMRSIRTNYDNYILAVSKRYDVDPALVKAVIHIESAFNPNATSWVGAQGLMQLMPGTAKRYGVEDAYDPEDNIRGGVQYLKMLLNRYEGKYRLALAAYNAGEDVVDRHYQIPNYKETMAYVEKVEKAYQAYQKKFR